jgi:4-amino-4-deoxy-L-arabinose transferase-like glycosyltransferase
MSPGVVVALVVGVLGVVAFFAARKLARGKLSARAVGSASLLVVLVCFFYLFVELGRVANRSSWLGIAILFGTFAVLRLMTRFEGPR